MAKISLGILKLT